MSAFVALQKAMPQHALSRFAGRCADSRRGWFSRMLIRGFLNQYDVNLTEAQRSDPRAYTSFNDFFTRALLPDARPLADDPNHLISPADGLVSQTGAIRGESLLQAKGHAYSLTALLTRGDLAAQFRGGWFATIYLAPSDYHRVHAPLAGTLTRTIAVPGALFSVNARTDEGVEGLFCRNERLVMMFDTAVGPAAVVMVGAMIVGRIDTPFHTPASPYHQLTDTPHQQHVARGEEIGRFLLGSTAIVVLPHAPGNAVTGGATVRMGQSLGNLRHDRN